MRRPRPHRAERGAALLIAIVAIAVLTALAVDLAYETSVRLRIAANARDSLRAEALAESGVTMGRLTVSFQAAVDNVTSGMCNLGVGGAGGGAAAGGDQPTPACPRLQLWNLIQVRPFTDALFADPEAAQAKPAAAAEGGTGIATASYGDFQGGFDAKIEDEGQKVNVQLDGLRQSSATLRPRVEALLRMMCESKWDPLFDRTDADGQRYSRTDVVRNLRDWVDDDANASNLTASFPGGNCSFNVPQPPFEEAFSDENMPYDRGKDRYKAKNARFDSLDELYLVAGITDRWMASFSDQLTVYLPQDAGLSVNTTDPARQLANAAVIAEPSAAATLRDPTFLKMLNKLLNQMSQGGVLSIPKAQFAAAVAAAGAPVNQSALSAFTDKTSPVYRIRSSAVAGDVTHEIEAVVTYDDKQIPLSERAKPGQAPTLNPSLGTLIRWHEE